MPEAQKSAEERDLIVKSGDFRSHPLAHILLHGKRDVFLEEKNIQQEQKKEEETNVWAANFLIPKNQLATFIAASRD